MNYKYIIALFGGEELDAWTPPKSDWVIASSRGHKGWNPEFKDAMMAKGDEKIFDGINLNPSINAVILSYDQTRNTLNYITNRGNRRFQGTDYEESYWYNEEKNFLIIIRENIKPLTDEQIINFIDSATVQQLESGEHTEKL